MKRHKITAAEAEVIAINVGMSWEAVEDLDHDQVLRELRFKNVLHQRTALIEVRAWAKPQLAKLWRKS